MTNCWCFLLENRRQSPSPRSTVACWLSPGAAHAAARCNSYPQDFDRIAPCLPVSTGDARCGLRPGPRRRRAVVDRLAGVTPGLQALDAGRRRSPRWPSGCCGRRAAPLVGAAGGAWFAGDVRIASEIDVTMLRRPRPGSVRGRQGSVTPAVRPWPQSSETSRRSNPDRPAAETARVSDDSSSRSRSSSSASRGSTRSLPSRQPDQHPAPVARVRQPLHQALRPSRSMRLVIVPEVTSVCVSSCPGESW